MSEADYVEGILKAAAEQGAAEPDVPEADDLHVVGFLPGELIRLGVLVLALSIPVGVIAFFAYKLVSGLKDKEKKREEKKLLKQQKHKKK